MTYTVNCTVSKGARRATASTQVQVVAGTRPTAQAWVEEGFDCPTAMVRLRLNGRAESSHLRFPCPMQIVAIPPQL